MIVLPSTCTQTFLPTNTIIVRIHPISVSGIEGEWVYICGVNNAYIQN